MDVTVQAESMESYGRLAEQWSAWAPIALFALLGALELAVGRGGSAPSPLKRIGTNVGLYLGAALVTLAVPLTVASAAAWAEREGIGLFNLVPAPAVLVLAVAIAARSFAAYWLHRASHSIPLLWRLHRVHHGDRQVDVSLSLRHHPLELLPAILLYAGLAALLGLPVWVAVLTEVVMMAATFWEHLAIRLPAGARAGLEPWLVLPETHLLHHSAERLQTDSNYSTLTIVWDRMFGTFRPSSEKVTRIGLGDSDDAIADSLWQQLLLPLRQR
jgi:sterol desaturase/sphingolipid hydroxylase (fatty acid hydroxylase superfamily)